jgi:hypothetical protein
LRQLHESREKMNKRDIGQEILDSIRAIKRGECKSYTMALPELPPNALAEIVDFVYFIRKKCLQPKRFSEERYETLLQTELQTLSHQEQTHLEQEFADYEKRYPYE